MFLHFGEINAVKLSNEVLNSFVRCTNHEFLCLPRFAKQGNFTTEQISAFFSLAKILLENITGYSTTCIRDFFQELCP